MSFSNKFVRRLFRKIDGLVWDITTGKVGLRTEHGIHSVNLSGEQPVPEVNPFEIGVVELPAFATQVPRNAIQKGDLIVGDRDIIGWVVDETLPVALKVMDHNGNTKTYTAPNVTIGLGGTPGGVLVVQNLFNLAGGADQAGSLVNNMLPFLLMGDGADKLEGILPFLLMQQSLPGAAAGAAGGLGGMNPALLLMMAKGKDGSAGDLFSDPVMMMAMMGGMGGGAGGMNPFLLMALTGKADGLFGGASTSGSTGPARTVPLRGSSRPPLTPI